MDNKQKAMDAAPLDTSIFILCSEVGFTFGNEIVQMLLQIWIYAYIYQSQWLPLQKMGTLDEEWKQNCNHGRNI